MVLKRLLPPLPAVLPALLLFLASPGLLRGAELPAPRPVPPPGEVTLPLADYLALIRSAEAADRERAERVARRTAPLAEVVAQRVTALVADGEAQVTSELEILVQGRPAPPLPLLLAGHPGEVEIRRDGQPAPGAAVTALPAGQAAGSAAAGPEHRGLLFVAAEEGRYTVTVRGRAALAQLGGIARLTLPPAAAPVAVAEIELPADASWSAPGGVVVAESRQGERRTVRLALRRGEAQAVELRRRFDGGEAEKLLAQTAVLTLFQLRPEGVRRHDAVLYEVARGGLASLAVELPPGLEVEQAGTDEGSAVPAVEGGRLTVHRQRRLQGTGYLVLTSTPPAGTLQAALAPAPPGLEVRARYLAVATAVAAEARPLPEGSWARVDLDDLPAAFREALQVADLAAAWRWTGPAGGGGEQLAITALPPAPLAGAPVRQRETTTLLTVDGTLLHRDRFTLDRGEASGAALDLTLPAGAVLWSARVGEQPVRPLDRGGRISVPLAAAAGAAAAQVVEVVSVQERALPAGRSTLALDLPQVARPVLDHRWRLLLPPGARYRYRGGDLRPAPVPAPREEEVGLAEAITVTAESPVLDRIGPRRRDEPPPPDYFDFDSFEELKKGLVGGVKPLPVAIPESGKALLLTGVLPPPRVAVELEVRARR